MAALALFDPTGHWQDTLLCEHRIAPVLAALGVGWGVLHWDGAAARAGRPLPGCWPSGRAWLPWAVSRAWPRT
jgi:hypothetical protein